VTQAAQNLLEIRGLRIAIPTRDGELVAVSGVDLEVARGDILGVVGESGSGKSLSMLAVMGLLPRTMRVSGSIRFAGEELLGKPARQMRAIRGRRIAMIFQDPMTALNPVHTIGAQLTEALGIHQPRLSRRELRHKAIELLELVAITMPERRFDQYPQELSGGMRQRVVIAIAMANDPDLLIADEPTTALDVTIQAQIVEILERLRRERGLAIVLITHDLGLVASLANRVSILYAGRVMERGSVEAIFHRSRHPYTAGLLAAIPSIDGEARRLTAIDGVQPSLTERSAGCPFHPRCRFALPICTEREPSFTWTDDRSMTACHRASDAPFNGALADAG
jgi:peptide/nickel transport system ATP-binding protein